MKRPRAGRRSASPYLWCWVALAFAFGACGRPEPPKSNVLVILIDTLRADRLGAYGNERGLTPFLDELAERGTTFGRALAASSWTVPSVASILTSRYPTQHNVVAFYSQLVEDEVTVWERLASAGWTGAGFSANLLVREEAGFGQGLERMWTDADSEHLVRGEVLRTQALEWLDRSRGAGDQTLLFLQYMEPHYPYQSRRELRERFAADEDGAPFDVPSATRVAVARAFPEGAPDGNVGEAVQAVLTAEQELTRDVLEPFELLYDSEVAAADEEVRLLFEALTERGFLEDCYVVILSDHGEEFADHGSIGHGRTLYEENVHVPLILLGPDVARGRRIEQPVSLMDVAPTLLELLGLPAAQTFEGRSLASLVRADSSVEELPPRELVLQLERQSPNRLDRRLHSRALVQDGQKLLVRMDEEQELYDVASDPTELDDLARQESADVRELSDRLRLLEERLMRRAGVRTELSTEDQEFNRKLRAIGY